MAADAHYLSAVAELVSILSREAYAVQQILWHRDSEYVSWVTPKHCSKTVSTLVFYASITVTALLCAPQSALDQLTPGNDQYTVYSLLTLSPTQTE